MSLTVNMPKLSDLKARAEEMHMTPRQYAVLNSMFKFCGQGGKAMTMHDIHADLGEEGEEFITKALVKLRQAGFIVRCRKSNEAYRGERRLHVLSCDPSIVNQPDLYLEEDISYVQALFTRAASSEKVKEKDKTKAKAKTKAKVKAEAEPKVKAEAEPKVKAEAAPEETPAPKSNEAPKDKAPDPLADFLATLEDDHPYFKFVERLGAVPDFINSDISGSRDAAATSAASVAHTLGDIVAEYIDDALVEALLPLLAEITERSPGQAVLSALAHHAKKPKVSVSIMPMLGGMQGGGVPPSLDAIFAEMRRRTKTG